MSTVHKRAMTLLLEREPFRYLFGAGVFFICAVVFTFFCYTSLEPISSYRAELIGLGGLPGLNEAQKVSALFIKSALNYMPVVLWLTVGMSALAGYMTARRFAREGKEMMAGRRALAHMLDALPASEAEQAKPHRLLPVSFIAFIGGMIVRLSLFYMPWAGREGAVVAGISGCISLIGMCILPFAMINAGSYCEELAREYLRSRLVLRSTSLSE